MSAPILSVHGVGRRFGGVVAVNDVSFDVEPGEILGVIGPNGAGKTTLMELLSGLQRPNTGRVVFRGRDVTRDRAHVRSRLGMGRTFQVVKPLAGMTVLETVTVAAAFSRENSGLGLRQPREAARAVVRRLGLEHREDAYASRLALADTKRLELAKALAGDPNLLLLDEVMGGLNSGEVGQFLDVLRSVREAGVTLVIVEHVMRAVMEICDRVVVLSQGKVIASGSPQQVTSDDAVIKAYLGARFGARREGKLA